MTLRSTIRLTAGALLVLVGLAWNSDPIAPSFAGCAPSEENACITQHDSYTGMRCIGGGGHCVTCFSDPNYICTWCGGDVLDYFNPSDFPPCNCDPEDPGCDDPIE